MKNTNKKTCFLTLGTFFLICISSLSHLSHADGDKGVGPVTELKLEAVNMKMAEAGQKIFTTKCSACHKLEERYVGPALKGVTQRRTPEWVMNMILNPAEMLEKNDAAKELLAEFMTPMTFQNVSQDDARSILEFFRASDAGQMKAAAPAATAPKTKKKQK